MKSLLCLTLAGKENVNEYMNIIKARMKRDEREAIFTIADSSWRGKTGKYSKQSLDRRSREQRSESITVIKARSRLQGKVTTSHVSVKTPKINETLRKPEQKGESISNERNERSEREMNCITINISDDDDWENIPLNRRMDTCLSCANERSPRPVTLTRQCTSINENAEPKRNIKRKRKRQSSRDRKTNKLADECVLGASKLITNRNREDMQAENRTLVHHLVDRELPFGRIARDCSLDLSQTTSVEQSIPVAKPSDVKSLKKLFCNLEKENIVDGSRTDKRQLNSNSYFNSYDQCSPIIIKLSPKFQNLQGRHFENTSLLQSHKYNVNSPVKITEPSTPQGRVIRHTPDSPDNSPLLYDKPPPSTPSQKKARKAKRQLQIKRWRKYEEKIERQERYQRRHKRLSSANEIHSVTSGTAHIQWKPDLEQVYFLSPQFSD